MSIVSIVTKPAIDWLRFDIRPLTADDSHAYRAIRQKVLDIGDGRYFSASYRRDKQFKTEQQWRKWCTEDCNHCVMGTFYDGELVGIMTVIAHEPKESMMAEWDSVWIEPQYRHMGIARYSYQKLAEWTMKHGFKRVETFVRADNHRMLQIRRKQASVHTHTKQNEIWADGSVGDAYFFEFDLQPNGHYGNAVKHLQSTLDDLTNEQPAETSPSKVG